MIIESWAFLEKSLENLYVLGMNVENFTFLEMGLENLYLHVSLDWKEVKTLIMINSSSAPSSASSFSGLAKIPHMGTICTPGPSKHPAGHSIRSPGRTFGKFGYSPQKWRMYRLSQHPMNPQAQELPRFPAGPSHSSQFAESL